MRAKDVHPDDVELCIDYACSAPVSCSECQRCEMCCTCDEEIGERI